MTDKLNMPPHSPIFACELKHDEFPEAPGWDVNGFAASWTRGGLRHAAASELGFTLPPNCFSFWAWARVKDAQGNIKYFTPETFAKFKGIDTTNYRKFFPCESRSCGAKSFCGACATLFVRLDSEDSQSLWHRILAPVIHHWRESGKAPGSRSLMRLLSDPDPQWRDEHNFHYSSQLTLLDTPSQGEEPREGQQV
jgi:hypothetical protein